MLAKNLSEQERKLPAREGFGEINDGLQSLLASFFFGGEGALSRDFQPFKESLDDRQITHLISFRIKHLLYDFFRGCFGRFI